MRPHRLHTILLWAGVFYGAVLTAAPLVPPLAAGIEDSAETRVDKGVESIRWTNSLSVREAFQGQWLAAASASWKTDWQTPQSGTNRRRQDGRWQFGIGKSVLRQWELWAGASGEHFDDRPMDHPFATTVVDLMPRHPDLALSEAVLSSQNVLSVRILRGGAGFRTSPWSPLTASVGLGAVEDKRIGRIRSGFGAWTSAAIERWNLSGYDQSVSVTYNRETPRDHTNEDLSGRYELYREFSEGNSNRFTMSGSSLQRDIYFDASGLTARREERNWAFRDVLTYGITRGVRTEVSGEILHQMTEQGQADLSTTSLEENQAGFAGSVIAQRGRAEAELSIGTRAVTQTVRDDILQGRKTDLSLQGKTPLLWRSMLSMRLAVSKYTLDTRSETNHDDRDELRYNLETSWLMPLRRDLTVNVQAAVRLDHLVYIFRESSANNRWTRYFILGSSMRHRPAPEFEQTVRWTVSSAYQDYDYETDPYRTRSTVHRRLNVADSLSYAFSSRFALSGTAAWQIEEFGSLYWDTFEEEKSDETRSLTTSTLLEYRRRMLRAGAGVLWDGRKGKRFDDSEKAGDQVFLNLRSYGPTFLLEYATLRGMQLTVRGRALRQFQLKQEDRWIVTGEIVGVFRW